MKLPHLLKQSAIRASAMIFVKFIGLIGRVILTRIVGAEGIGLYQIAYSLYGFLIMLSGGLPTVLAIITAKKPTVGWRFLKILSLFIILSGCIISLIIFLNSTVIAELLGNTGLEYTLRSLAPAILAAPLLALLRGYLQGLEQFSIIAASEVVEQVFRVFCMLLIVYHWLPLGVDRAVGKGVYATFIGVFVSFIMLAIYVSIDKKQQLRFPFDSPILPFVWFFKTSFIITLTRLLIPTSDFIDAILIPNRLVSAGYSASEATSMFGIITGMATIIAYAPTLITGALSHTMTMRIATYWQQGSHDKFQRLSRNSLKFGWLWGLLSATFLFVYSKELSVFIFITEDAYLSIKYMAAIPLIVGFREISTSILWSQDIKKVPFLGLSAGICSSILIQYFLIGIPGLGYIGAAAGIMSMEIISSAWNIRALDIKKDEFIKIIPLVLMDIVAIFSTMGLVHQFTRSFQGALPDITKFLTGACLFFLISGLYIFFRCTSFPTDLKTR